MSNFPGILLNKNAVVAVGSVFVATAGYTLYNTFSSILNIGKFVSPLALPFINTSIAEQAIKDGNAGLLDFSFSLDTILSKIPFVGEKYKIVVNTKQLEQAINQSKVEVSEILLNKLPSDVLINPLKISLSLNTGAGDYLSEKMIIKGVNLNEMNSNGQNILHDIVSSGKQELIEAAFSYANPSLKQLYSNSANENGNNIAHIAAVSPKLREIINEKNIVFSPESLQNTNHYGKTPLDVVYFGYENDKAGSEEIIKYIEGGARSTNNDLFGKAVIDGKLSAVPHIMVEKNIVKYNELDSYGKIPLDYAVFGTDELAFKVAHGTDKTLIQNAHLAHSLLNALPTTTEYLCDATLASDDAKYLFYKNPLGDGESILSKMIINKDLFDEGMFRDAYASYKKSLGTYINPIEQNTALGVNLLHTAALVENRQAMKILQNIIKTDGLDKHLGAVMANNGNAIGAMMNHGFTEDLNSLTEEAVMGKAIVDTMKQSFLELKKLKAITDIEEDSKVVVKQFYIESEKEYLNNIEELQTIENQQGIARRGTLKQNIKDKEAEGIPEEVKIVPAKKYDLQEQKIAPLSLQAATVGYLGVQLIESKESIQYFLPDSINNYIPDDHSLNGFTFWNLAHFAASAALIYGTNPTQSVMDIAKHAGMNTGVFAARKAMSCFNLPTISKDFESNTNSKGVLDFIWNYGGDIVLDTASTVVQTAAMMALTGVAFGSGAAIALPALITASTSLVKHLDEYNGHDQKEGSFIGKVVSLAAAAGSAYSFYNGFKTAEVGNVISQNLQTIQKYIGTFSVFSMTHALVNNLIPSSVSESVHSAENWLYDHTIGAIFGSADETTQENVAVNEFYQ